MDEKASKSAAAANQGAGQKVKVRMEKRKIVKEDGRTLIFYSFTDSNSPKQVKS